MKMKRLAYQLISIILILSITLGCSIFNIPIGASDPNREIIIAGIQDAISGGRESLNQAEQDMTNLLREQSGARAAFGDQADALFLQIDQNKSNALKKMMDQATGAVSSPFKVSALISKNGDLGITRGSLLQSQGIQILTLLGSLADQVTVLAIIPPDENGNRLFPTKEVDDTIDNASTHVKVESTVTGSSMEVNIEMVATLTTPFGTYVEKSNGTLKINVCPDANGDVPMTYSFRSGTSLNAVSGMQLESQGSATGHVNDEGEVSGYDLQATSSAVMKPAVEDWEDSNKAFEYTLNLTVSNANPENSKESGALTRVSSELDQNFKDKLLPILSRLNGIETGVAIFAAEKQWSTGYCVEIQVPEVGAGVKSVQPNSDTPFTANVHHKFEGVDLQVPVIATLSEGQVSVSPSGSKVPAPANFTYKAPGEKDKSATVNLVTRSKRGIATLDVKFKTGEQGWKVDWTLPNYFNVGPAHFTGMSCSSPYGPWEIKMEGTGLSGSYHIPFSEDGMALETFEEQGNAYGGSIGYQEVCSGNAAINPNSGGYQIELPLFTCTGSMWAGGVSGPIPQPPGPGLTFPITPADPGQCSQP